MGQCLLILAISLLGQFLSDLISFPIPKTIIASLILFVLLELKVVKVDYLRGILDICRKNLAFFFMPVGVAIMTKLGERPSMDYLKVLIVMIISTCVIMIVTGKATDIIIGIQEKIFKRNDKGGDNKSVDF